MKPRTVLDADAVVVYHTRVVEALDIRPMQAAGGATVRALGEQGVLTAFVAAGGTDAYSQTEGGLWVNKAHVTLWTPEGDAQLSDTYLRLPVGERGGVTGVRVRVTRFLPEGMDRLVPMINGPKAMELDNKVAQRRIFGDRMANGVAVPAGTTPDEAQLGELSDDVWVKAADGLAGKGARRTTRTNALTVLSELKAERTTDNGWVIEDHDLGSPVPWLKATIGELQRFIDNASPSNNHELRMFCSVEYINGEPRVQVVPMFRHCAGQEGNTYIPVDPGSVPLEAVQLSVTAAQALLRETGYPGAHVAVDVYRSAKDGQYKMREWNVRDPGMGSWLYIGAKLLTSAEQATAGAMANRLHGNLIGGLLARLAKAAYNKIKLSNRLDGQPA